MAKVTLQHIHTKQVASGTFKAMADLDKRVWKVPHVPVIREVGEVCPKGYITCHGTWGNYEMKV